MARTAAEHGREVRAKLLTAAAELIPELGWAAVSTRALAARAGVRAGLVHYHFRSVQALLREAAIGVMREQLAGTAPLWERADDPETGLGMLLGALDAYTGDDPTSLLFVESYLAAGRDEALRAEMSTVVTEFRRELAGWLDRHGHPTPEDTAAVLAAAVDGVLLHRTLDPALRTATVLPVLRRLLAPASPRSGAQDDVHVRTPDEGSHRC
ncbi:MAG: TetR/AcrR family transcriptional regulator [Actinomycetota bacterium]|nr:TetR/AcrR family transcriptional regulator [Actinomycetota bacterium]